MKTKPPMLAPDSGQLRLPRRRGSRPAATATTPHVQLNQKSPVTMQDELWLRMTGLSGVRPGSSVFSPNSRALHLDGAGGPATAFAPDGIGTEFAHLHHRRDGSLHLFLPEQDARLVVELGWGEFHPVVALGMWPPTLVMVYGPRDAPDLDTVFRIFEASYRYARGDLEVSPDLRRDLILPDPPIHLLTGEHYEH